MIIYSIVPRLPPAIDGVGDYALNLARQLRQDFHLETHFIVSDPARSGAPHLQGCPVSQVTVQSSNQLHSLLLSDGASVVTTVLLHYVGYGYAKRGCPLWLVDGLQRWRSEDNNCKLVTMFHEIYAFGPPWTSSFWLSPVQRVLAARLVKMSNGCITSKTLYAKIIRKLSDGQQNQISTLPVFSNVGEVDQVPSLAKRSPRLVIFGGRQSRFRVYRHSLQQLKGVCQFLRIKEILDIGPPIDQALSLINGVPIMRMGCLSTSAIQEVLQDSIVGFFDYPTDFLAKSTIFAAYCSYGLLPVSANALTSQAEDGIEAGKHYWTLEHRADDWDLDREGQAIANHAHAWYQTHTLSIQAGIFASHLTP
ncbi:MAG: hypothetical protein QNJ46_11125 [Leptolyngbyaceae cyanobacterium MO_188.B28]|nr:hypothetical protein [Leptolyngbyaceae cyanobacterium MO_188.B28]